MGKGEEARAAGDIQAADTGRAVEVVGGKAEQIDTHFLDVYRNDADRIDGVGVKDHLLFASDGADFLDGLNGSGLVVAVHDRYKDGFVGDGIGDFLGVDPPALVHRHGSHLVPHRFESAKAPDDCVVLDVRGDDMFAFLGVGHGHALDGMIDRFGAAGVEHDFLGKCGVDQASHRFPGALEGFGRRLSTFVLTGGVVIILVDGVDHG